MTTIITALRGNNQLTKRWANAVLASNVDGNSARIVVSVNNDLDRDIVLNLFPLAKVIYSEPYSGNNEEARVNYICSILEGLLKEVTTDVVFLWDDDILPDSAEFANKLVRDLKSADSDVAGVTSQHPLSQQAETSTIVYRPYGRNSRMDGKPNAGIHQTWSGGTAFSAWASDALKLALPLSPLVINGTVYGWDRYLAVKLEDMNLKTLCDLDVTSRHDQLI